MSAEILIVDDEPDIRELIGGVLEDEGYLIRTASTAEGALAAITERKPELVILDVWLQGSDMDGLEMLNYLKSIDPVLPVIVISGHGSIETAVTAIRRGAYDFLEKPFKADRLLVVVERALEAASLKRENSALRVHMSEGDELLGKSAAATQLRLAIDKVAPTNSRVLITGPSGAGKELAAKLIHRKSRREKGPFVVINAASITPDQMESELFGRETPDGRIQSVGLFEQAHRGTFYLDEIGEMPLGTQNKILRVLTEQRFRRVGGKADVSVDVRLISSTSADLQHLILDGKFREASTTGSMSYRSLFHLCQNVAKIFQILCDFRETGGTDGRFDAARIWRRGTCCSSIRAMAGQCSSVAQCRGTCPHSIRRKSRKTGWST